MCVRACTPSIMPKGGQTDWQGRCPGHRPKERIALDREFERASCKSYCDIGASTAHGHDPTKLEKILWLAGTRLWPLRRQRMLPRKSPSRSPRSFAPGLIEQPPATPGFAEERFKDATKQQSIHSEGIRKTGSWIPTRAQTPQQEDSSLVVLSSPVALVASGPGNPIVSASFFP